MSLQFLRSKNGLALQLTLLVIAVPVAGLLLEALKTPIERIAERRQGLASALAAATASSLPGEDLDQLHSLFESVQATNPELLSIALRQRNDNLPIVIGPHDRWNRSAPADASQVVAPVSIDGEPWGDLELRFQPAGLAFWQELPLLPWPAIVAVSPVLLFLLFRAALGQSPRDQEKVFDGPVNLRQAVDFLSEGVLLLDHSGRILLANRAFAQVVGKSPEALAGKRPEILPWVADRESGALMPWTQSMRDGRPVKGAPMVLLSMTGASRAFTANCYPIPAVDGRESELVVCFEDISALEQSKRELQNARDAAELANRAKTEFLANMSHEIRTPMNAILGFADVLRRGLAESRQHAIEYLNTIHSSGRHLLDLINDVLDLSKIEAGRLQIERLDAHPHELLHDVVSVLGVKAREKGIFLEYGSAGPIPETIQSDPTRLRQIVTNLVGNAIKFTEIGGVRVHAVMRTGDDGEPVLEIDVTDTGVGMSASVLGKVFEPFVQADSSVTRKFGGTGLGLAISRRYARALGGDIVVTSESGRGSTFSLQLPTGPIDKVPQTTAEDAVYKIRQRQQTRAANPFTMRFRPCRILVVDDGEANRQLLSVVLRRAGATVEQASNGQEAVDIINLRNFDVVLMDMQMPVKDGYTATTELREHHYRKPIIALTGHAMKGDEEKCLAAGCSDFLTKPVDIDALLDRIAAIVGQAESSDASGPAPAGSVGLIGPSGTSADAPSSSSVEERSTAPQADAAAGGRKEFARPALRLLSGRPGGASAVSPPPAAVPVAPPQPQPAVPARPVPPPTSSGVSGLLKRPPLISRLPMSDPEFRGIVQRFVARLKEEIVAMVDDLGGGEEGYPSLAHRAHWLKGTGGTVGLPEFTEPARQLEAAAKSRNRVAAGELIRQIAELAQAILVPESESVPTP